MEKYKEEFIKFLVKSDALRFGEFKLKSGRVAPYFLNTGMFNDGDKIKKLGEYYSKAIMEHFDEKDYDTIYGPAYKGIPLCTATSIALSKLGINKGYTFNRKKKKDYALKDNIIGLPVDKNSRMILVDDVITAGTSIRENLEFLKDYGSPRIVGIVISLDRLEKGTKEISALKEMEKMLNIKVYSVVNMNDVMNVLHNNEISGKIYIDDEMKKKIDNYLKEYGAKE